MNAGLIRSSNANISAVGSRLSAFIFCIRCTCFADGVMLSQLCHNPCNSVSRPAFIRPVIIACHVEACAMDCLVLKYVRVLSIEPVRTKLTIDLWKLSWSAARRRLASWLVVVLALLTGFESITCFVSWLSFTMLLVWLSLRLTTLNGLNEDVVLTLCISRKRARWIMMRWVFRIFCREIFTISPNNHQLHKMKHCASF